MIVVMGAAGRTGRVVVESLLAAGKSVRAVVRDARGAAVLAETSAEVTALDLADASALRRVLDGAEAVYSLLPEDLGCAADFAAHRLRLADNLASAIQAARVPHVVFLSAAAAVAPEGNGPAQQLHVAESLLRDAATTTVLRASYFQENVLAMLPVARQQRIYPSFLPADLALPTIATVDIGRIAARCLLEPAQKHEIIDLIGPSYSARDIADHLGRALDRNVGVVELPRAAQLDALLAAGLPRAFAESVIELHAFLASGHAAPCGDRKLIGSTRLDQTLTTESGSTPVRGSAQ